jgi:hypothetical protein
MFYQAYLPNTFIKSRSATITEPAKGWLNTGLRRGRPEQPQRPEQPDY